jgi:hypothetical protein
VLAASPGVADPLRIAAADYADPVTRYGHDVLGGGGEYETLRLTLSDGRRLSLTLSAPLVFEDLAPRLADLDGDGAPEVLTVESHDRLGAQLRVWTLRDGAPVTAAAFGRIGTRHRWLAPVGAADLTGDGAVEIAYVDRPHLARTLRVWRYLPGPDGTARAEEIATLPGVTNHRIGETVIHGGIRRCDPDRRPEIILADAAFSEILAIRLEAGGLTPRPLGLPATPDNFARALACRG